MICALGLCPRSQAGKAMEAQCDLSERGGTLMMRRVVSPRRQASSSEAMSSMCQLGRNGVVGLSSMKLRSMKAEKSWRRKAWYSSGVRTGWWIGDLVIDDLVIGDFSVSIM